MSFFTPRALRNLTLSALLPLACCTLTLTNQAAAQENAGVPTQTLIRIDSKTDIIPTLQTTMFEVNNKPASLLSLNRVQPNGTQVAILIDDGLRRSAAVQFQDIADFLKTLPDGTEVLVGYMTNGSVRVAQPFTTDHAAAAGALRIPFGIPGQSASPYFCLSEFVKHWPGNDERQEAGPAAGAKARFALMITDGVDPYNGSTSILNQDSPYVQAAIDDAERAGVAVSSIYYGDAGIRGGRANFSGQSYLKQVADSTGGVAYYEGSFNPVSFQPFLKQFRSDISETYVATFSASPDHEGRAQLVRLKVNTTVPKLKLRHPDEVRPGNHEGVMPATSATASVAAPSL